MKTKTIISVFALLAIASCHNSLTKDNQPAQAPKALQDKTISMDVVSKRYNEDLVNALYNDLLDTNLALKKLENEIESLEKSKDDSTELFNKYNNKNAEYFGSANEFAGAIKDSLLKERMKVSIVNSSTKYNASISRHKDLLKLIKTKTTSLNDLHLVLKITRTLPLIEKYQKDYLPSANSINGYIKQLDQAIKHADTLSKQ